MRKKKTVQSSEAVTFLNTDKESKRLYVRIPATLKSDMEKAAEKFEISLNRFTEGAIAWYIETLKKEGSLK